jgi:hypothetical protein
MTLSSLHTPRTRSTPSAEGEPRLKNEISLTRTLSMHTQTQNTGAWLTFTYVSFAASAFMMALGIWALPADLWIKGYLMMASVFMLGSAFTLAKTVRDEHEAKRLANRIEDAKAERLLMEVGRST